MCMTMTYVLLLHLIPIRHEFDSENVPDLTKDVYMQDIHCVGSLCKLYFRELPNPLLTYQLYDKFAVSNSGFSMSYVQRCCKMRVSEPFKHVDITVL